MAPDQLGRLLSSGTVPTTAYRPGGPGRGLAQSQASELSVGALVCCARFSRQAGDREYREENPRGGWGTLGHPSKECPGNRTHRAVATLSTGALETDISHTIWTVAASAAVIWSPPWEAVRGWRKCSTGNAHGHER